MTNHILLSTFCAFFLLLLPSCASHSKEELKVAASSVPHAEMLEAVKEELKGQGIDLVILVIDDYNIPNRALADKEVDANFFQHLPFMEEQIRQFSYPIESLASIEIEPMGIYSKKIESLSALKDNAIIAIPHDPTNEGRALLLLQAQGLVALDDPDNLHATLLNIKENPRHLKFIEVDAAMLPRTLEDVDAAVINTNYALEAHLFPLLDALVLENKNSPYANVIAIRTGDQNREDIQALKAAMTSERMRAFILEKYKGAVIPAF